MASLTVVLIARRAFLELDRVTGHPAHVIFSVELTSLSIVERVKAIGTS